MEVIRKTKLEELLRAIDSQPYGKFLISGAVGSGKSYLLNNVARELQERGKNIVYEQGRYFNPQHREAYNLRYDENSIRLIDGLDEAYNAKSIISEMRLSRSCYICTARENVFDIKFDFEFKLEPLTSEQVLLLIKNYIGTQDSTIVEELLRELGQENITPRLVAEKIICKLRTKGFEEYFLNPNSHQLYTYGKGVSISHPQIIVPERKIIKVPSEIKNDINVVTRSLLDKVAIKPEILQTITSRQFEEMVCELFERNGYNVQLTRQTRDGGKDLIILNNSMLGDLMIYAECKKYSQKHPVNVGLVRELYGTIEADRATAGIMVTTSYFSKDAQRFQEKIKSRMNFIDYSELMKQISMCHKA